MFTFSKYHLATSLDDAYEVLLKNRNNAILGGTAYLRMGNRNLATAVDLSALNLDYIREEEGYIEIGAMTNFRSIETSELLLNNFGGVVARSVMDIVGVQLRNVVTVGATVFSRYGFSDFIPALLALNTVVVLQGAGEMTLEKFLESDVKRDILVAIRIEKNKRTGNYQTIRRSNSDYALLNVVTSNLDGDVRIVVGARPGRAVLAKEAMKYIEEKGLSAESIEEAGRIASEELEFTDNMRASGKYREAICKVMVKRSLGEVM
ncbi:molybdopterin dehydrogenase [Propionigenium maris DSM 9537]|uniref:Molybdopterin dehydrogenase n=1 Tax=Propionigenium maris DSM 9537 TaxID=1123000 RepID=A0A9W6GI66_9FUSO|nr:FAD binding domain-containing protein [Propionigenium maris]GLI54625.1 molybdopterin dehydrogenase [Propionigenium maris DSM 9537]